MIGQTHASRYEVVQKGPEHPIFEVFLAKDRLKGTDVLLRVFKEPFRHEPGFVQACFDQTRSTADLMHPGLERVLELETDPDGDGPPFLVCELSQGQTLHERLRKFVQFSPTVTIATAINVCDALAALHQQGQCHGDISSSNIAVSPDGAATLLQVGLWRAYSSSGTAGMVALPGMAPYLAPEVSEGGLPSPSSDVYSVGVLIYEMLTGSTPYRADSPLAIAMKHASAEVPSPRLINSSVPMFLDELVRKAMAKSPFDRYTDAREMMADLRMLQDALRFGKPISWSNRKAPPKTEPKPLTTPVAKPKVQRPPQEPEKPKPKEKVKPAAPVYQDDVDERVPAVLKFLITFFAALLVFVLAWWVIFNLGKPKLLEVPNIQGMTLNEAKDILRPNNLRVIVSQRQPSEEYGAETIMDVSPEPGMRVREGSVLNVVVSSGSRFVQIPDLRGYTVDAARSLAENLNLKLDDDVKMVRNSNAPEGTVVGQDPEAGSKAQQGQVIQVRVSGRRSSDGVDEVPTPYTLRIRLTGLSGSTNLKVDIKDDRGQRTVYENFHEENDSVVVQADGFGDEVVFYIFYDGEMVKSVTQKKSDQAVQE